MDDNPAKANDIQVTVINADGTSTFCSGGALVDAAVDAEIKCDLIGSKVRLSTSGSIKLNSIGVLSCNCASTSFETTYLGIPNVA